MTELSPEARALFAAAREDYTPSPERLAKVGTLVAAQVGAAITVAGAASAGAATAGKASGGSFLGGLSVTKIVGAIAVVVAGAGVATLARPTAGPPSSGSGEAARASAPKFAGTEPIAPSAAPPLHEAAELSPAAAPTPEAERAVTPSAPAPRTARRDEKQAVRAPAPKGVAPERVVLEETEEPASTNAAAGPSPRASSVTAPTAPIAPAVPTAPATRSEGHREEPPRAHESAPAPDVLAREVELLQSARRALASGDPARALALTSEYSARYPRGALRQEVLVVRALSLCNSGRTAEGRRLANAIEKASPRSPHVERLRQACGAAPKP